MSEGKKNIIKKIIANVCRFILAITFLFSGFVKANDPLGTVFKLEDYLSAWTITGVPRLFVLLMAIAIAFFEFTLGIYLFFGVRRKWISRITLVFMSLMTILTVYIAIANPVSDCGCFGDAIILTNVQTLIKNIVLLVASVTVFIWYEQEIRIIHKNIYWIVSTISGLGILAYATYCIYALPVIDFLPYKVGTDLRKMIKVPKEQRPQFEVTIVYEKNGKTIELGIDDEDPDSTWKYVETRRKQISGIDRDMITDFYIQENDEDITDDILGTDGYLLLLTAPNLQTADESIIDLINDLYDYSQQSDMEFYCLTASDKIIQNRWTDYTGAEYMFYNSDERTLKTMARSNPGLIMLKDGKIVKKWSSWNFPTTDEVDKLVKMK